MERHKKERRQRKKAPGVPIKTYRWEDVRRSRSKGGYPWTYLYKEPFDEEADPTDLRMEGMPKSRSSSTLGKSSEGVDIREITNGTDDLSKTSQENITHEPSGYVVITEVPSDSENHSKVEPRGSITIQEEMESVEDTEPHNVDSTGSSDNISQYLDKDESVSNDPQKNESMETLQSPGTSKPESAAAESERKERAKSEEPKRKRKLSVDSSYSRKSLSRLAILKKLKEAKDKIKVPKLSLPSLLKKDDSVKIKKEKKDVKETDNKEAKETPKGKSAPVSKKPAAKPVYIHIPLKPPEGQTDEFSYLEFEEKKESSQEKPPPQDEPKPADLTEPVAAPGENSGDNLKPSTEIAPKAELGERRYSENPDEIVAIEILKSETIDLHENGINVDGKDDIFIVQPDPNNKGHDDVIIILSGTEEAGSSISKEREKSLSRQSSRKVRAKSAEPERKRKLSLESSHSRRSLSKLGLIKKFKDAKDKFKFPKLSLSRSNSKKDKAATVKEDEKAAKVKEEDVAAKVETKEPEKLKKPKGAEPKYIRIPLKPPPGQSDEFSYLEFEEKKEEEAVKNVEDNKEEDNKEEQSSIESPESVQTNDVQFIFLTPPSDDEILDSTSEIPETPSSVTKVFFEPQVQELKQLAKGAVDKVSPESQRKILEAVTEESETDKVAPEAPKEPTKDANLDETKEQGDQKSTVDNDETKAKAETQDEQTETTEKMVIDEEDGLKLTESAMAKQEQNIKAKEVKEQSQELKSSLKSNGSPILRKKVSFKRRSRDESKEGIYEEIRAPDAAKSEEEENLTDEQKNKLATLENSQSMSIDEEKSYLDEKIIKSASLEEDYNRWSKIGDHEYEPVNPPPDDAPPVTAPLPTVQVTDTDQELHRKLSAASSTTSLERRMLGGESETGTKENYSAQEMQTQIEVRFFNAPSKTILTSTKEADSQKSKNAAETVPDKTEDDKKIGAPGKFQQAIKAQAGKFRTKLHELRKPSATSPPRPKIEKPNSQKFKFKKPNIHFPKIPDTTTIHLPTFSLPRKKTTKRSLKERQLSTESNAGDSKKKYFDFSTYPRIFKKKPKSPFDSSGPKTERDAPEFATVPRTKRSQEGSGESRGTDRSGGSDSVRVPLNPEESLDDNNSREDSVERRMASHIRYDEDIDIDDAYERENQEIHRASPFSHDYNSRWDHGSFHPDPQLEYRENLRNREYKVTDLDSPGDGPAPNDSFDTNTSKDVHSSESSLGAHRRGVLEEIDSDEFFLREKGISQDNIEVGRYLSSEIREAFKYPTNALLDLQRDPRVISYETRSSNQSLPETVSKRKAIKKPKRKKTPHVSQEQIAYDDQEDSEPDHYIGNLPPARPKRRSKKNKKSKDQANVIPYQETIPLDVPGKEILGQTNGEHGGMYENEQMEGKEQPEIKVTDPYADFKYSERYDSEEEDESIPDEQYKPEAPPRRQKSLRSLNLSEHDSILGEYNLDKEIPSQTVEVYKSEYIIPTPEESPVKPPRTLSRSSSRDSHEFIAYKPGTEETPAPPARTRSRSGTRSQADDDYTSRGDESVTSDNQPCSEEPCIQDLRDYMGYAIIDKQQRRDPPLPPPKTPPRRKKVSESRFFTVPRPLNDAPPPVRPLRNYSTLGPSRPPRRKHVPNMTDEEKENIEVDITQYIEIEEEPNRDLHSGEVIQKMRDRPLPAPPRPPRKTRAFNDVTSEENVFGSQQDLEDSQNLEETEVSTQTEPLPDDFVCEEVQEEESDTVLTPNQPKKDQSDGVERRLITPTHYTHEETITHGSLIVEPLNGARILPDSDITRRPNVRTVPVTREFDDSETSEIPAEFKKLKDPTQIIKEPISVRPDSYTEIEILRAQKLQVADLDVDRLSVNELLASRIVVSEIDSDNIRTREIGSKSGALKVGEIELPPSVVQQLFEKLQSAALEQQPSTSGPTHSEEQSADPGQKKTPIDHVEVDIVPQRPPRKNDDSPEATTPQSLTETEPLDLQPSPVQTHSLNALDDEETGNIRLEPEPPQRSDSFARTKELEIVEEELTPEHSRPVSSPAQIVTPSVPESLHLESEPIRSSADPPQRPPRHAESVQQEAEPEVDDEPPPRPPQPRPDFVPSQPPASFYALRAHQFVENLDVNIPVVPRRRRHHKPPVSGSSSDESPAPAPSRRRHRSPEPTIPQLAGRLARACGAAANGNVKRLIAHVTDNVLGNADGKQDLHVMIVIMLVLIAGLILLGYGDEKTVHLHHWEYFNPPRDM